VAYDDLKRHEGRTYSGMAVGGRHVWEYTGGLWDERKAAPDRWEFTFSSVKRRTRNAPDGSGVPPGSQYHWYILAHQKVRKLDADAYETFMEGVKYKVAHKRPHWRNWSSEYPDNEPETAVVSRILEEELGKVKSLEPVSQTDARSAPDSRCLKPSAIFINGLSCPGTIISPDSMTLANDRE
jgi:hypothetical protein